VPLALFPLPRKPVEVRTDGGAITSDAGALLLREIDERLGLTERLAQCLPDPRQQTKVRHSLLTQVRQRIYQIACGYEDANDADSLRTDPALKLAVGRAPSDAHLASQPTLSRLENAATARICWLLSEAFVETFIACHREHPPSHIILDPDATDDETHGQQELSFYHGYYQEHCYLPLLIFASADDGEQELIAAVLRPGNAHAGRRAMAILQRIVARLRAAFPICQLELRADSGLALPEVYTGCAQINLPSTISLPKNDRLLALAAPWREEAQAAYAEIGETVQRYGEFAYAAASWPTAQRVIVKAEMMRQGENPRFVVTTRTDLDPEALYHFYCQRGDPENRIKELKLDLKADRLSCHRFWANQFRLLLHAAAYLLLQAMRRRLAGTELAAAQAVTLQLRLLKVGARIVESVRRVRVSLPSAYPWLHLWRRLTAPDTG
jgi:hypothetical protein